jgi:hypothetical protein
MKTMKQLTEQYNLQPETNPDVLEGMKEYCAIVNKEEKKACDPKNNISDDKGASSQKTSITLLQGKLYLKMNEAERRKVFEQFKAKIQE